ncbi:MAG TPA: peptidyl-prolyl cis-trans isomerase [Candidatus Angelobacter sp.]|nr:peptidyl-prolyl cis-trans isomerase [Candidatus Angelobacter sp.]
MIRFLQSGNKVTKYLLGGLLLVICGSMVTYLIPGFMSGVTVDRGGVVASVAGHEITNDQVQQAAQRILRQQRYPDAALPFVVQQVMPQLIQEAELQYEAGRMGLSVSDQEIRDELQHGAMGETFFPGGKWIGQQQYEDLLRENGLTTDAFEKGLRDQLLATKLLTAVTAGVTVSPSEIEKAYREQNTKVKFDYAIISMDDVQKQINPTEAELKTYYDANKTRYQNGIPEKRQVRYFLISQKQVEDKAAVTPADVEQYYRSHLDSYRTPDRVKVRHILIQTPKPGPDGKVDQKGVDAARAKAADILKQIKAGGDFADLAKKNSDDPGSKGQGGELDWIVKGQTVPEFEKAAFSMDKGQISDLVRTSYGFHIIQTEDKEVAHVKTLAEVKDSIEQSLKRQKVAAVLEQMATSAEADARKTSLDKAAAQYETQVIETNPVARTDALPGVGASPELMNDIFTADQKSGVQSTRTPQGAVIFQVSKIIPPRTPSFEEFKDRVTTDFKAERASTLLSQKTTELSDRAHAGHDLHKAAKELGATVKSSDLVARSAQVPDVGPMSGSASVAFTLKPGEISGPLHTGRNGLVLEVTDRQEPSLTADEFAKAKDNLREQLAGQKRQEVMQLFMSSLNDRMEKEGKLKINKNELGNLGKRRS